jgi:hypothetical protein
VLFSSIKMVIIILENRGVNGELGNREPRCIHHQRLKVRPPGKYKGSDLFTGTSHLTENAKAVR